MRSRIVLAMVPLLVLAFMTNLDGQYQQRLGPGQTPKWATGTVKEFSTGSLALAQARDVRDPRSQSADMTFVITADTVWLHRESIREGTTVVVHYVEQNGKLIAESVASYGLPAPYSRRNPYGAVSTPQEGSPSYLSTVPPASNRGAGSPQTEGGCRYSAGPCLASPGPQSLPAGTAHDFNSVRQQADALAKQYQQPKLYNVHLNYMNDAVWQAEFDYVTAPSGKHRNSRWGDCRVHIDPARGNARQYETVVGFNDQMDEPPPVAPSNLVSPWESIRSMNIPASIRQSQGGIKIELHQVGATHRVVRPTYQEKYMQVVAQSVASGRWVWATSWPFPANPNTGSVYQILYVDAVNGRGTSECANMPGMNENSWSVISCPIADESSNRRRANRFPK